MANLFKVTLREHKNELCERDVYVKAKTIDSAAKRAQKANPHGLWKPRAVVVKLLGDLLE